MDVRIADLNDVNELVRLAKLLWPDSKDLADEMIEILNNNSEIIYLIPGIAFGHMAMRYDYVSGSSTSPVGYLEGIYVEEGYRKQGIASQLIHLGEQWAKDKGAKEMASDVLFDNHNSMVFHEKYGFKEVERVVCYIKEIRSMDNE